MAAMPAMYPETVAVFYQESKAAREGLDDVIKQYRTNTTAVLALATGAATFFGLEQSVKGPFYVAALAAYGVAVLVAAMIYLPWSWVRNAAHDMGDALTDPAVGPISVAKAHFDLALAHQEGFRKNLTSIVKVSRLYRVLLAMTALVIILAGVNTTQEEPDAPDEPTRVILVEEQ
jgi:hypothetical protein